MEGLMNMTQLTTMFVVVVVGLLANVEWTHGRHLRKMDGLTQQVEAFENFNVPPALTTEENTDEVAKEEKEAKEISSSLSSLKLSKIPHRIYVAG